METLYKNGYPKRTCMCGVMLDRSNEYPTEGKCWHCGIVHSVFEYNFQMENYKQRMKNEIIGKTMTQITKLYNDGVIDIHDFTSIVTMFTKSQNV